MEDYSQTVQLDKFQLKVQTIMDSLEGIEVESDTDQEDFLDNMDDYC